MRGTPVAYETRPSGKPILLTMLSRYPRVFWFISQATLSDARYAESIFSITAAKSAEPRLFAPVSEPPVFALEPDALTIGALTAAKEGIKPSGLLDPFPLTSSAPTPRAMRSAENFLKRLTTLTWPSRSWKDSRDAT